MNQRVVNKCRLSCKITKGSLLLWRVKDEAAQIKVLSLGKESKKNGRFVQTSVQLAVLLLVTVLTQAFLPLVCSHLVTFSFLATGHIASSLV